jgi:DNA-binding NarL/FixJ family response regulator
MFHHRSNATRVKTIPPTEAFTEREWEVLYFLQQGLSRTEIANLLNISPGTIKIHINHLYMKTKTSSYPDFIKLCSKYDLLDYIPEKFFVRPL